MNRARIPDSEQRSDLLLDLLETAEAILRANLRRESPAASREEIERRVSQWYLDRGGAPPLPEPFREMRSKRP
jgi:hypothetical protein